MDELGTEKKQNVRSGDGFKMASRILLIFLGLLIIGAIGYFTSGDPFMDPIFAHAGGLGILGLLGGLAGNIAKKKGYSFWKAFLLGSVLPIILGVIAVLSIEPMSCGGTPSITAALLIVIIYSFPKRRDVIRQTAS